MTEAKAAFSRASRMDAACDEFESAWQAGSCPHLSLNPAQAAAWRARLCNEVMQPTFGELKMIQRMILRAIVPVVCAWMTLQSLPAQGQGVSLQPHVEVGFDQALARVGSYGNLEVQALQWIPVYKNVQEAYIVNIKIPEQVIDPTTEKPKTIVKTVPEARTKTKVVMMLVPQKSIHELRWGETPTTEIGGGPVESKALRERLAKPILVLISYDGKPVPESFAMLFMPGTLVLDLSNAPRKPDGGPPSAPIPASSAKPAPAPMPAPVPAPPVAAAIPAAPAAPAPAANDQPQEEFALPKVLPPMFRLASIDERGQFVLRVASTAENPVTKFVNLFEEREVDGKKVITCRCQPVNVLERYAASVATLIPSDMVSGRTVEGKPMADIHLKALKQREIAVVVSRDGMSVDPFWLQNIKPKMLVLMPPASQGQPPPLPASTPAPQPLPASAPAPQPK